MSALITALGGALQRRPDGWYWSSGAPEPRVFDRPMSYFAPNFRMCGGYVEIPRGWEDSMVWDHAEDTHRAIRELIREASQPAGIFAERIAGLLDDHRVTQPGWRVPVAMWDAVMSEPVGAGWDGIHETDILSRAKALGWQR
jgi:hypothetical protein